MATAANQIITKLFSPTDLFQFFVPLGVFLDFITTTLDVSKFGISREHSVVVRALFSALGPSGLLLWFILELVICFGAVAGLRVMGRRLNVHHGIAPSVFLMMFVFVAFVNLSTFFS